MTWLSRMIKNGFESLGARVVLGVGLTTLVLNSCWVPFPVAVLSALSTSIIVGAFLFVLVKRPIGELIRRTEQIGRLEQGCWTQAAWGGEIGQLSAAITSLGARIGEMQESLHKQKREFQELFEQVPCYVTEVKRLEEGIRKTEEKCRTIFNSIPSAIFVLDEMSLTVLDCNDSVTGVYGYEREELAQTSFLRLFEEGDQERYASALRSVDMMSQTRQVAKDGRTVYADLRVSPLEYMGHSAFLVSTNDITKRLVAEQQFIQASKMATLGEMATGIAHELNQPLSVMKTASNFLMKKVRKAEPIREDILKTMAEEIDRHVDRASKIINHLRDFGRKSEVVKAHVDVNLAMEHALDMFSQQLRVRGIEVVREFQVPLPPVLADVNRLEQVFINLLINARDAIQERSESGRSESAPKQIRIVTGARDRQVVIEVHDTGPGIQKALMDRIFEPFFTTKGVGKGTGLGLSISYGIVQDYDGTIQVESREGEGATFIVQFPIAEDVS